MNQKYLTNYNNKLSNDFFIHISAAPANPILDSSMPFKVMIIEQVAQNGGSALEMIASGSSMLPPISFEANMIDFARCGLFELTSIHSFMSHGICREEFIKMWVDDHPDCKDHALAIYVYQKLKQ